MDRCTPDCNGTDNRFPYPTLFRSAQSIDRTGYARGTLAPRQGMQAEVPAMDPRVWLGMQDMMGAMSMGGMDHGSSHAPTPGMGHAGMDHGGMAGMEIGRAHV